MPAHPPHIEVKIALHTHERAYEKACDKAILENSHKKDINNYLQIINAGENYKYAVSLLDYQPHEDLIQRIEKFTGSIDKLRDELEENFQKNLNENKLSFNKTLDELNTCKNKLEKKSYNHFKAAVDKQKAYSAISDLYMRLKKEGETFFCQDTTLDTFNKKYHNFQNQCLIAIEHAKKTGDLDKHRGIKPILTTITNCILCIPLLIATVIKSIHNGKLTSVFFKPGQPDSEKTVDDVSEKLKKIKPSF